jgi:RimJ/RimL family protein N-acetyltransferase
VAVGDEVVRDVILRDGSTLRLRSASPEDLDDIKTFYEGLSEQSRYLRFHGFGRPDAAARDYAEADGDARVALIARQGGRVVAAAGYDRLREPGAAEVAFTVADDFQGRGTATRLLEQLASIGAEKGISRFDAEVMSDNRAMLAVFKRAGFELRRQGSFDEVVVSLDIRPTRAWRSGSPSATTAPRSPRCGRSWRRRPSPWWAPRAARAAPATACSPTSSTAGSPAWRRP